MEQQARTNRKLGAVLLDLGYLTAEQLINALDEQYRGFTIDLDQTTIPPEVPLLISEKLARRHNIIPISVENNVFNPRDGKSHEYFCH